ncbi:hypothetical protein EYY94_19000 [Obesumbacterium proteus]|uniref:hypothetical protein n=1 Tax=Obesumbacterium proteus TaxID=82983 RepID=UPI0010341CEC|nr:hypothetical protein [Obesumbacterium proteus]TBL71922.1 hypothetical protein EYY94_19000 [Obesumbacterium proteus]
MNNRIKIKAHSQSINKVVTRFEGEFGVKAEGAVPTDKLESLIAQLKLKNESGSDDIDSLILEAFTIGARAGFYRALTRFEDGKITARKVPNEDRWGLYSSSTIYQITKQLPSTKNQTIKAVAILSLAENGFK